MSEKEKIIELIKRRENQAMATATRLRHPQKDVPEPERILAYYCAMTNAVELSLVLKEIKKL